MWRTQWTGCHGEERHGGDRGCGGHNGQGVMVRRDMEVTEVVDEDAVDSGVMVRRDMEVTEVVDEDAVDSGVMVRRDMEVTEVVEDAMDRVSW